MDSRCKPADPGGSQACIPITHNWETMKRNSQLSRRLRRKYRGGPGEASLLWPVCGAAGLPFLEAAERAFAERSSSFTL
jgi:hypothetical protein